MTACDNGTGGDPYLPGTITISPSTDITTGTELTATYSGSETVDYQWKNDSTNVGTNSNKFTPTERGSYTVTVSAAGYKSKTSAAVFVTVPVGPPWTAVTDTTFGPTAINAIAYGNGKFVAVGNDSKMAISADGVTWSAVDTGTIFKYSHEGENYDGKIRAIAYGNNGSTVNTFVAVGDYGKMATSADGITWTAVSTGSIFRYSSGGTTYYAEINSIAYDNGMFVTGGRYGKMATSTDGVTWTAVSNSIFTSTIMDSILGIAYGNGKFVAVGSSGKIATSTNGTTWTAASNSTFGTSYINSIAYGNDTFVAVNPDGKMAISTDGTTWSAVTQNAFYYYSFTAIAYNNGKFVAGARYGQMATSTDGVTWIAASNYPFGTDFLGAINGIAYGNGKFVAVGDYYMVYLEDN